MFSYNASSLQPSQILEHIGAKKFKGMSMSFFIIY